MPGSGVRVRDTTRAMGRFDAMLTGVDSVSGAVVFRVAPSSLIAPLRTPRPEPPRRARPPRSEPSQGFSPSTLMTLPDGGSQSGPRAERAPISDPRAESFRFPWMPLVLVALLLAIAAAGVVLLLRPRLAFTNTLAGPVRLIVGEGTPRTVAPGERVRVGVARGQTMVAQWELVRPLSADGQPMGEEVRGSAVLRGPSGTMSVAATSRTADHAYFAPLVTNASAQTLASW